jgi:hypothetical protein
MSTGVPLMSLRFFFAILVLNTILGTNNTLGVFVTTLWQGSIGLLLLSFIMMKKLPNPLYEKTEALRQMGDGRSIMGVSAAGSGRREVKGGAELSAAKSETAPLHHGRPKRFVYGETKANRKD